VENDRQYPQPPEGVTRALRAGMVIPAHPLALKEDRSLDERHQRALTRYYLDAGAGGVAVGVHTTEFAIHDSTAGLYRPVLELAAETARAWKPLGAAWGAAAAPAEAAPTPGVSTGAVSAAAASPVMIAGIIGETEQAVREAQTARELGYHVGLLGLGALKKHTDEQLVEHARRVARVLPVMGFYLQPAAGGRVLSGSFWRRLAEIPNLVAVKIAPFNRYYTLAVIRAVAEAGRAGEVALYTGNDDSILIDLLTRFEIASEGGEVALEVVGGLLGHWAYWTSRAVEQLERVRSAKKSAQVPAELLSLAAQVTESNEAVFDPEHSFRGCISGILYVLKSSGLVSGVYPLGREERLSPGQAERIDAAMARYPHLTDGAFVRENLDRWLA
jgi:dihydrodipicolinate synthase/N-acetylneuraminate lyase